MGRKKKKENENIDLIPIQPMEDAQIDVETEEGEEQTAVLGQEPQKDQEEVTGLTDVLDEKAESESSALFGKYVSEENKWERKNRIREEKERAKIEKKRAKYADLDDDAYEKMKAKPVHKFFGVLVLILLIAGIAMAALLVYKLVLAPSYAQVEEKEKNIHVEGFATDSDTSRYEQQATALEGIASPSDLTDTWVAEPFTPATPTDVEEESTDVDGGEPETDDTDNHTTQAQEDTQE